MAYTLRRKQIKKKKTSTRRMRCQKGGTNNDITIVGILVDLRIIVVANVRNNNSCSEFDYVNYNDTDIKFQEIPGQAPQNFAFENSSGTSNLGENFPKTFLPIRHYQLGNGCNLLKTPSIHMVKKGNFIGQYGMTSELFIINYIIEQIPANCRDSAYRHLMYFGSRFGCWKELQISAALGGGAWDSDYLEFKLLKEFVLSHDCIPLPDRNLPATVEKPDYYKTAKCQDEDENKIFPYYFCKRLVKLNTFNHETSVRYDRILDPPDVNSEEGVEEKRQLDPKQVKIINDKFNLELEKSVYKRQDIISALLLEHYELNTIEKLKSCFIKYYACTARVIESDPVNFSAIILMPPQNTYNIHVANQWFQAKGMPVSQDQLSESIINYIRCYKNNYMNPQVLPEPMRVTEPPNKKKYPYHADNMFNWKICKAGDTEDETIEKKCKWLESNKRLKIEKDTVSVPVRKSAVPVRKSADPVRKSVRKRTSKK